MKNVQRIQAPFTYDKRRWFTNRRRRPRGPKKQHPRGPRRRVGLQTEAVVVTETRLLSKAQIAHSKEMHLDKEKIGRRSYQT